MMIVILPMRPKGVLRNGTMPFGFDEDAVAQLDWKRLVAFSHRIERHSQPTFARQAKSREFQYSGDRQRHASSKFLQDCWVELQPQSSLHLLVEITGSLPMQTDTEVPTMHSSVHFPNLSGFSQSFQRIELSPRSWTLPVGKQNTYDAPQKLPGIPDSWDGVPMESPIPGLNGSWPVCAKLGLPSAVRSSGMVSGRQVRNLGPLEPAVRT